MASAVSKIRKIFTGPTYKLLLSLTVISGVYSSFIPNKLHLLSTVLLLGSFEIHWVRQYQVNFMGQASIVNTTVYKTEPIFTGLRHGKLFWFLAATKQLYEWFSPSVCPSVRLSVFTNGRSDVHAKGQGHRSKVKVTEVIIQLSRFRTVTPLWIYIWWWNDA